MFAKVFTQIFDSSIAEDYRVRFVFEDMLKLANQDGVVDMTHESISRRTNVPLEIIRIGIDSLESPDPKSRSKEHEGRRIVRLDEHRDWGWFIVNYHHYRELVSEEQRREKTKERVRKFRSMNKLDSCNASVTSCNANVMDDNACNAKQKEKEKEKKKNKVPVTLDEVKLVVAKTGLPESDAVWFWNKCEGNGWTNGGKPIKSWPNVIAAWKAAGYMPSQKPKQTSFSSKPEPETIFERDLRKMNEQLERQQL